MIRTLLTLSTLSLAAMGCSRPAAEPHGAAAIGAPLPDLAVRGMEDGAALSLRALQGKVVLLDVWASWCAPCQEELPALDDIAARLRDKGVEIVAVSVDEERHAAVDFLKRRERWTLRVAHDPDGKVPSVLEPPKMPTSYLIDRKGVVRIIHAGYERADAARIEAELVKLAEES